MNLIVSISCFLCFDSYDLWEISEKGMTGMSDCAEKMPENVNKAFVLYL